MLRFPFPVVVDTMDDEIARRWSAWPERLFCVDVGGTVRYVGEQGPFGFWPRKETPPYVPDERFDPGEPLDAFLEEALG